MALNKAKAYIPLTEGMTTDKDDKFLLPGEVELVENGVYRKENEVRKRNGFTNLGTTDLNSNSLSNAHSIAGYKNEVLQIADHKLYSYSPDQDKWVEMGDLPTYTYSSQKLFRTPNSIVSNSLRYGHVAEIDNIRVSVFTLQDSYYAVQDTDTGAFLVSPTQMDSTSNGGVRVLVGNNKFYIVTADSSGRLDVRTIDPATPTTLSSATAIDTDANDLAVSDMLVMNGNLFIAYKDNASGNYQVQKVNGSTLAVDAAASGAVVDTALGLAAVNDSGTYYLSILYTDNTGALYTVNYDESLSVDLSATVVEASTRKYIGTIAGAQLDSASRDVTWYPSVWANSSNSEHVTQTDQYVVTSAGSVTDNGAWQFNTLFVTGIAQLGDNFVAVVEYPSATQPTAFLVDVQTKQALLKFGAGYARQIRVTTTGNTRLIGSLQVADNKVLFLHRQFGAKSAEVASDGLSEDVLTLYEFEESTSPVHAVRYDRRVIFLAGLPRMYDGQNVVEEGYTVAPEVTAEAGVTGSGTLTSSATYNYAISYQWLDATGVLHRSAPTLGTITLGGSDIGFNVTARIPNWSDKIPAGSFTQLHLVGWLAPVGAGSTIYYKNASTPITASSATFSVQFRDDPAETEEILYTNGGILDNGVTPETLSGIVAKDRLFFVPLGDRSNIQYSNTLASELASGYNEGLTLSITPDDNKTIVELDEKLVVFKREEVYVTAGDGPNDTGIGGFLPATKIHVDAGLKDVNSVVKIPSGILFKSHKGIKLLTRSLESVDSVGDQVSAYDNETILRALLRSDQNEVWLITNGSKILVYNYTRNKWSVFTGHDLVDGAIVGDLFYGLKSNGQVIKEDTSSYLDNSTFVSMKVKTGWVNFDGPTGIQRLYDTHVVGEYHTPHKLQVKVSYDGYDASTEDHEVAVSSNPYQYDYGIKHRHQKCTTAQYTIQDAAPDSGTGTGKGFSLNGLEMTVGVHGKSKKTPTSRRL